MLILTADHDDRVVPAHSYKFAAALQAQISSRHPVLLRVDTNSGHASSSLSKQMETFANIATFLVHELDAPLDRPH